MSGPRLKGLLQAADAQRRALAAEHAALRARTEAQRAAHADLGRLRDQLLAEADDQPARRRAQALVDAVLGVAKARDGVDAQTFDPPAA